MDDFLAELRSIPEMVTLQGEAAWKIEDALDVIAIARKHNRIILGGDILTVCGEYTYDNWYYNQDHDVSMKTNVEQSAAKSLQYINNYIKRNGKQFLVVFVFK